MYRLKTVRGYNRRIKWLNEQIKYCEKFRGTTGNGTFYEDTKIVDDHILDMRMKISGYELCIEKIKNQK